MKTESFSLVLSGEAGQGLNTLQSLLLESFFSSGYYVFSCKEFMSRVRGGNNSVQLRIGKNNRACYAERTDLLIVLNHGSIQRLESRLSPDTVILGREKDIESEYVKVHRTKFIDTDETLKQLGGQIYFNVILLGIITRIFGLEADRIEASLIKKVSAKGSEITEKNKTAFAEGWQIAAELDLTFQIEKAADLTGHNFLTGTEALGIGAVAGGCNFIASYPMSPATGLLNYLAHRSTELGIVYEQAEDEIAAINMCLGAWYAGGRAIVTTSGGGFALMEEGVSLAGIIESPAVIHIAQRPGPGTGLPTRTEQGDLNLALHAGHGDLLRIILAPGDIKQAIENTQKAFYLADKYQIPVFILSDQYFVDNCYTFNIEDIQLTEDFSKNLIIETAENYLRYDLSSRISPRGIPGHGEGLICLDSDEHDESGRITEDFKMRTDMVEKRMSKLDDAEADFIQPVFSGNEAYKFLLVGWGSNLEVMQELISELSQLPLATLHFPQVYPIPRAVEKFLQKAEKIIVIENNYSGQFADLLEKTFDLNIPNRILQYDGMPFSIEYLQHRVREEIDHD